MKLNHHFTPDDIHFLQETGWFDTFHEALTAENILTEISKSESSFTEEEFPTNTRTRLTKLAYLALTGNKEDAEINAQSTAADALILHEIMRNPTLEKEIAALFIAMLNQLLGVETTDQILNHHSEPGDHCDHNMVLLGAITAHGLDLPNPNNSQIQTNLLNETYEEFNKLRKPKPTQP